MFIIDQTPEEIERTKEFSLEVVDLLKHNPQCRMPFNKFIPSFHHHFGRQCRVSDYGFTKLLDLFEAIPHIVDVSILNDKRNGTGEICIMIKFCSSLCIFWQEIIKLK